jgi:hypothetical protein
MAQIEDALAFLRSSATDGYGPSSIPSKIDDEVRAQIARVGHRGQNCSAENQS